MSNSLSQKQEDLALVVEPLVDSISELCLSAVTGAYENVQTNCTDIAERTNKLVLIAQQVATSSTDVDMQMEVANAINDVAVTIERLVTDFTQLLINSNATTQKNFAAAAREVGEAINKLCAAADATSQQKIINAVKECIASAKDVQDSSRLGKEKLLAAAQVNVDKTVRLVKVCTVAASSTADEKKKKLLEEGAEKVKLGGPALIQAAKGVNENPNSTQAQTNLNGKSAELSRVFEQIINAAKLSPQYFGKMNETYEYVQKLIEMAKSLSQAAQDLYTVAQKGTNEQFMEAAKLAANKALQMVAEAEAALNKENDPVKKHVIKNAIAELRDASQAMIKAAKAYRENPTAENKAKLDAAHARLDNAIRAVLAATSGDIDDGTPRGRLAVSTNALEAQALNVINAAKNNPSALVNEAQSLAAIALATARDIEAFAATVDDPVKKKRLLDNAAELKNATQRLIAAAKKVAANPNDPEALRELNEAHKYLLDKLNEVRRDAGLTPGAVDAPTMEFNANASATDQLVDAAKEEAKAALVFAEEAEKLAEKITDPVKKEKLKAAIKEVKFHCGNVIEFAELVRKNPNDPLAQEKLTAAQRDLGNAIQKVVDLTTYDRDVNDAMKDMNNAQSGGTEALALESGQKILDEIAAFFGNPNKQMTPAESIAAAKALAAKAAEFANQLKEMANNTKDPVFKEKLLHAAKICRDGGVQIKILAAVRAAGGEDKGNTVGNSAKGLQTNIQEIMKVIRSESIRTKFRNTVKTTMAINKVVKVWKSKAHK